MRKEVQLTLTGMQRDEEGQENITRLSARAEYYLKDGSHYILYEENQPASGLTKNTIKFKSNLLEVTKRGAVNSRMVFEKGKEHMMDYATPFGLLRLGVLTHEIVSRQSENSLKIQAHYSLTQEGQPFSYCKITINIQDLV